MMKKLICCVLAMSSATSALAVPNEVAARAQVPAATAEKLRELRHLGTRAFHEQRYADALVHFVEMESIGSDSGQLGVIRRNIGRSLQMLGRYEEARASFVKALGSEADPERQAELRELIQKMDRLSLGGLDIRCQPADVHVELVDGTGALVREGTCPARWQELPRGRYSLNALLPLEPPGPARRWIKERRRSATVEVIGGLTGTSDIMFPSSLTIDAPPRSRVSLDGEWQDSGGPRPVEPGERRVRIQAPGRPPWTSTVVVAPGEHIELRLPDAPLVDPPPARADLGPWLLGAGAVMAAAAGGVLGYYTYRHYDDADAEYHGVYETARSESVAVASGARVESLREDGQTLERAAWISGGFALALGGAALVLALTGADDPPTFAPQVDARSGSMGWNFTW